MECGDILQQGHGEVCLPLCATQSVCVCLHSFVHGFLIWLGVWCGYSIIVRCCSLSVNCIISIIGVGDWAADFKLAIWSWNYLNCSSNSAKGQWALVSSLHSPDESLSYLDIVWSDGTRSREAESWGAGTPSASWFPYLVVFCGTFQGCLAEPSEVTICGLGTCACCSGCAGYREAKVTYQAMVALSIARLVICHVSCGASHSSVCQIQMVVWWPLGPFTGRYLWLCHCKVSHRGTSVKVQNAVWVQNAWCTLWEDAGCMVFPRLGYSCCCWPQFSL